MTEEYRRSRRRKVSDTILVTDAMSERVVGRVGNLSETGLLLIGSEPMIEDALYQLKFQLREADGGQRAYEIGVHMLWRDEAGPTGLAWSGFRFIAVPAEQATALRQWIDSPGGQYE